MGGIGGHLSLLRRVQAGDTLSAREWNQLVDAIRVALKSNSAYQISDGAGMSARRPPQGPLLVRFALVGPYAPSPIAGRDNQWDYSWIIAVADVDSGDAIEQSPVQNQGNAKNGRRARNIMEQNNTATSANNGEDITSTKTSTITVGPIEVGTPVVLYTFRQADNERVYRIDTRIPVNVECVIL